MNMLSSLKALLFSSAAPGVASAQPAASGDTADFAALFNGATAEGAAAPALPQIDVPAASADMADLPSVESQDAAAAVPDLPVTIGQPQAEPPQGHVPHGLAIAVAAGKSLPLQLPPGRALGLAKQLADAPVQEQAQVEPAHVPGQPEAGLPDDAPVSTQAEAAVEAPVEPEAYLPEHIVPSPEQTTTPIEAPKPRPAAHKDEAQPDSPLPVIEETAPVEIKVPPKDKQKAKAERTEQGPAPSAPAPRPLAAADAIVASVPAEPVKPASADRAEPIAAVPEMAAMMTVPAPSAPPVNPAPVERAPDRVAPDQPTAPSEIKRPSAAPDAPVKAAGQEAPAPELVLPAAPFLNGKPVKAEAIALLQIVREQVAVRQTGASVRIGEQVSAAQAKADTPARPAEPVFDPSTLPPADAAPAVSLPQASSPAAPSVVPSVAPAMPSPDLSASLSAQVVDMGVSGQWIDGLARDIAGLSANGAQGRFQIDTHHLGAVQVNIRHDTDGAAVSLTVASEAAETALRQDSDRLKLDAGLAAVRIAEVKVERAPAVAETHRAETGGQSSSQQQQQQQSQQGSQASPWAQNSGQNMGQPQGQQNRWQGRENSGFGPKGSGDPAVLNHADAPPAAHDRARARYA